MKTIEQIIDSYKHSGYREIENGYEYNQVEEMLIEYSKGIIDEIQDKLEYIGLGITDAGRVQRVLDDVKKNIK